LKTKKLKFLAISILIISAVSNVFAQGRLSVDKIIAKVDNYIVLKSDVEQEYLRYISNGDPVEDDTKCRILEGLIITKLLVANADIDSVVIDQKELEDNLNRRMQYFVSQFGSEQKLEAYYKKSISEYKNEFRPIIREQMLSQKMQGMITEKLNMTPSEVRKFFGSLPKDSIPYFDTEVEIGQIVKIPTVAKAQKQEVRAKLQIIKDRIAAGEDFAVLAKEFSEDYISGRDGGDLGFMKRGDLVPEYEGEAYRVKIGELSNIIESQFGFHLIQVQDRKGNEFKSRHILLKVNSSNIDIKEAQSYLDSIRNLIVIDTLKFEKAAKEFSDDKASSANGGLLSDQNGNTRQSIGAIDPIIYFTIDSMQVGSISRPLDFRTEDGKDAVRILYYKSKTPPHQANLKDDFQKIYNAALSEKKNKAMNEWFNKNKKVIFVEVDEEFNNCNVLK